jgi:cobalt/nickel transport system permease protein
VNHDRAALIAYLVAVVAITLVHRIDTLAVALGAAVALAGRDALHIARRTAVAVGAFVVVVALGYVALSLWRGEFSWRFLLLLNLRVFLLTFCTMLLGARVNALRALSFSRTLVYVLTLAYSQLLAFRRLLDDFRLAFTSRAVRRPTTADRYRHAARAASFFLGKAMNETTEITMAMTSRGFFDDPS